MRTKYNSNVIILLAITTFVVTYVREVVQYHRYSFWKSLESIGYFLISYFIHFFAIFLVIIFSSAFVSAYSKFFLGYKKQFSEHKDDEFELFLFYALVVLLVAAVFILFVAHWPQHNDID